MKIKPYHCPIPGCNKCYYRKYQLVYHGRSLTHRDVRPETFAFLVKQMPPPDLSFTIRSIDS